MRNVQNIEFPDGRLMTIEGGDAATTAHIIANKLLLTNQPFTQTVAPNQQQAPAFGDEEPVLQSTAWNRFFAGEDSAEPPQPPPLVPTPDYSGMAPTTNSDEEEPILPTPIWNFSKPKKEGKQPAAANAPEEEEVLATPVWNFSRP